MSHLLIDPWLIQLKNTVQPREVMVCSKVMIRLRREYVIARKIANEFSSQIIRLIAA